MRHYRKLLLLVLAVVSALSSFAEENKVVRILAIGNSFSQDAVEQYLHELAAAEGYTAIIGNLYIGGCTLEKHYNNAQADNAAYSYRKIGEDGVKVTTDKVSIATALADEQWDYVSLQQASGSSGQYDTYTPYLTYLINYVKERVPSTAKLMWHQTWAYAQNSTHSEFSKYDKSQSVMYEAIMSASKQTMTDYGFSIIIPSGTAVQNARTSFIGDSMNRDGYHLEVNYGRYTAACTWFEAVFGKSVVGNTYAPSTVRKDKVKVAQEAAHAAVSKPYEVTDLSYIEQTPPTKHFVRSASSGTGDGLSWDNATDFNTFYTSFINGTYEDGDQFYIAEGTYVVPSVSVTALQNKGFTIMGGYDAALTGTDLPDVDYSKHRTVISGDINGNGVQDAGDAQCLFAIQTNTGHQDTTRPVLIQGVDLCYVYSADQTSDNLTVRGALFVYYSGNVTISHCDIHHCQLTADNSRAGGAALLNYSSTVRLTDCRLTDNRAAARGGAIRFTSNDQSRGYLTLERCLLANNEVTKGTGSALCVQSANSVEIVNSTITANKSAANGALFINGANSSWPKELLTVVSSTIANNDCAAEITFNSGSPRLSVINSIIAPQAGKNAIQTAKAASGDALRAIVSGGWNMIGAYANTADATDTFTAAATDTQSADITASSVFGENVLTADGVIIPVSVKAGAKADELATALADWGLSTVDTSVDQLGTTRDGSAPGAVVVSTGTGITAIVQPSAISGAYYTLQGVRVQKPARGIYVHGGKKVVVK